LAAFKQVKLRYYRLQQWLRLVQARLLALESSLSLSLALFSPPALMPTAASAPHPPA